jgi:sulfopyruvate decarboxylase subunit alpha
MWRTRSVGDGARPIHDSESKGHDVSESTVQAAERGRPPAWADLICDGLEAIGSRHVVYVPDNPLSYILRSLERRGEGVSVVSATREEEAIGIAAGLYLGGATPTVMMQSSGLGNALNAIGSLLVAYQIPALLVMSMRGDPGEWNWAQVPLGRAVRPILDSIGIQYTVVERSEDARIAVEVAGKLAFGTRFPTACLLPRRLTAPATERGPA